MGIKQNMRLVLANCLGEARLTEIKSRIHVVDRAAASIPDSTRRLIVIGCPDYDNLGDHAIALAQRLFIESRFGVVPTMLYGPLERYWETLQQAVRPDDVLCLQGGGNMGTMYEIYENERLAVIDRFRDNKIVVFPQTISYGESKYERLYMRHVAKTYNSHPDLHLVARERMSFDRMKRLFPKVDILFTPDIVLSLPAFEDADAAEREGLCLCLRADKERRIDSGVAGILAQKAGDKFGTVFSTDTMHPRIFLSPEEGEAAVRGKISELSRARLVVTDRIHGMIFCALSGTPCIALNNSNGKVGMEYEWLRQIPYIRFAESPEEAASMFDEETPEPGRFPSEDFTALFDSLADVLALIPT